MSQDTARAQAIAKHDRETGQGEPTLLDQIAQALAQERFAASLAEIRPHCRELAYRSADAALCVVQPDLDRLTADNERLATKVASHEACAPATNVLAERRRVERDEARASADGWKAMVEKLTDTNKRLCESVANGQRIVAERDSELSRLRDALTHIAEDGCESYTTGPGSCINAGRSRDAEYTADRWCDQCVAYDALTGGSNE
jgi:hypothetical protein